MIQSERSRSDCAPQGYITAGTWVSPRHEYRVGSRPPCCDDVPFFHVQDHYCCPVCVEPHEIRKYMI